MAGVLEVRVLNEQKRGAILEVLRTEPLIASVAASSPGWLGGRAAFAEGASWQVGCHLPVRLAGVLWRSRLDLVRGRGFTQSERSSSVAVAVVSDSVARQLWPGGDAVGQFLRVEPDTTKATQQPDDPPLVSRSVVVVGVARDVEGFGSAT